MAWAGEGRLPVDRVADALRIAGTRPGLPEWHRFLNGFALWLGAVFLGAAVIFFFAYNWKALGQYARFGIVELLLIAALFAALRSGLDRTSGKAALLVVDLLIGALLALIGQTYQTGADPWELFAIWSLFTLPLAFISRFAPLWIFWLLLINLSITFYHQALGGWSIHSGADSLLWILVLVDTLALVAWERVAGWGVIWMKPRWAPRLIATAALCFMTFLGIEGIVETRDATPWGVVGYSVWLAGIYYVYRHRVYDLYMLAAGLLSFIIMVAVFLGHSFKLHNDAGVYLLIGMIVLGLSAAGGWWLRNVAREVGHE